MRNILGFLLLIIKIYISVRVIYVLYMVNNDPSQSYINELIWWSGVLIFDMWITGMLPPITDEDNKENNDDYLDDFRK